VHKWRSGWRSIKCVSVEKCDISIGIGNAGMNICTVGMRGEVAILCE
jgi:hypothetical protein